MIDDRFSPRDGRGRRVVLFLPSLEGGGAERTFLILAEGLTRRGWSVDLVIGDPGGPLHGEVSKRVNLVGLGAHHVRGSVLPLARYLRRRRPDAVLTAMTHANLAGILAVAISGIRTGLVVTEHQHLSTFLAGPTARRARLFPWLIRLLYPRAKRVIAVSEGVAEDLARRTGIPRAKIGVEKNPIRIEELRARGSVAPDHPWLGDGKPPVILAVGRLTRQKDFATLLRAFRLVRDARQVKLIVLGEGDERQRLEALIDELGIFDDVEIMGFLPNPYPYYGAASLFVLSSLWEGLPTVLLEAMVFGLPIVSTDCPSGPGEILEGGRLGELVPSGDPSALAQAIASVLSRKDRHAVQSYDNLSDYDVECVVDRYSALLHP